MNSNKIHIYFVPGLAASSLIFENIRLPKEQYEIHYLEWLIPTSKTEAIKDYAQRMCSKINHKNPILVGVSFGGIMVQEMSKIIPTQKIIIISSVKTQNELPKRLRIAKNTKIYKLFPTKAITNIESFSSFAFGSFIKKRVDLYKKYLSMRDEKYLPWAIENVLNWQQEKPMKNVIHIHGNNDGIFPVKHIKNSIEINGGTHIMILNKAKQISKLLIKITAT